MKKKIVLLFISVLLLSSVVLFTFTACGHRDICSYKEGTYRFDKELALMLDDNIESDSDRMPSGDYLLHRDYNLHIQDVSLTFKKIGLIEYNKAKGKNVIKNSKDLKTYHVDLYIKFAEEEFGHVYDFVFDGSVLFEHGLLAELKNEELNLDIQMTFTISLTGGSNSSRPDMWFLWSEDAPTNAIVCKMPLNAN